MSFVFVFVFIELFWTAKNTLYINAVVYEWSDRGSHSEKEFFLVLADLSSTIIM